MLISVITLVFISSVLYQYQDTTIRKCPPHLYSPLIKIIIEEIRKACKKHPINHGFNSTDNAYEPLKLMQAVMAKTNEVCLRYLDNSMLYSLPAPSNTYYYETSIAAVRNRRRKMEDRHVVIHDLNTMFNIQVPNPSSYYAIFDGHAGHDAAAYGAAHLHQYLAENRFFSTNPKQALLDAFCKTDALFLEKCQIENLTGGTTAVVALLRAKENVLYIAWVGDSQALLVNQGKVLQCVNPHKPNREDERERIEKAGGCVMLWGTWRVNGQLAVSRAIGDADYKPHVTAIPDVRAIFLDGGEDFLIVACDGLWDFLSEDAAAQEVYYMIAENPDDTERISKHLVQLARYEGSTDNISVIVVFLRDPHQIAAEAHRWATRNGPTLTTSNMEAGLDNANNPFNNSNGSLKNLDVDADNINLQKSGDGLLLNLTDNFKANGTELSKDIFEKSNGTKKSASDLHFDDDFGPETNVDAVDDAFSPLEKDKAFSEGLSKGLNDESFPKTFNDEVKAFTEGLVNNNPLDDAFNPFLHSDHKENITEDSKEIDDFEEFRGAKREETPTPPADAVHDVGLEVNPAESDSEDEWNYIKGDQAKPENLSSQPETVLEASELDDAMSQLNPNAAEFVPVSPTRSIPSPACRALINDEIISQSPKRPVRVDIHVPSETEFESEVKSRPSDFDKNGHDSENELNTSGIEKLENILNGKNMDEILDFHPGSTPTKLPLDEFHFGPNSAPFTPRVLDQSEAFSTKANYGDDTEHTLNTSFNDSELAVPNKEQADPMSTSFYAEKGEFNPFQDEEDLNKVHELPDNLDEFLQDTDQNKENILGKSFKPAIQTTDLDKISQDDEKELASPLEDHDDLLDINPNVEFPSSNIPLKTSESNLLDAFIAVNDKPLSDESYGASLPELEPISSPGSEQEPEALSTELTSACGLKAVIETQEPEFNPNSEVENIFLETKKPSLGDLVASSAPACEFVAQEAATLESQSPIDLLSEQIQEEEITSSVKDDVSSPIEPMSPIKSPESLIDEFVKAADSALEVIDAFESHQNVSATNVQSQERSGQDLLTDLSCPLPVSQQLIEPQVETNEINMFEPSAPLEPRQTALSNGLDNFASDFNEQISIKTDNITPEFAEPAVITPSEESKATDEAALSPVEEIKASASEAFAPQTELFIPHNEEPKPGEVLTEAPKETRLLSPLPIVPVALLEVGEVKAEERKSPTPASGKKPIAKVEPRKPSSSPKVGAPKPSKPAATSSRTGVLPKVPLKLGPAKPSGLAPKTTSTTASKPLLKPKTSPAPKPTERKPTTTLNIKPAPRTTLAKKPTLEAPATKTNTRPTTSPKPAAAPRPTTAPRTLMPKTTTSTIPPRSTAAAKPRVPLTSRATTTASASRTTTTATASRVTATASARTTTTTATRTVSSTKTATAPPKPKTLTSTAPKPRVPLTKTVTKSADVEKEKKESANKLTASRNTAITRTTSGTASSRTTTTNVKKLEIKPLSDRTVASKTTTSTTRTTTLTKKPGDVKVAIKTTKIEKPKQNGVAPTNITEEITVVNNVVNESESDNLVKDNSPLDNKLLIETNNALLDMNPAD